MRTRILLVALTLAAAMLGGCASIAESTNTLSDERLQSLGAGALGYEPAEVTVVSRRTEGVNTYFNLRANDGGEFACIVNGGNFLSAGMTNPPSCNRKGEPVRRTSPL